MNTRGFFKRRFLVVIMLGISFLLIGAIAFPAGGNSYAFDEVTVSPRIVASITWYWFGAEGFSPSDEVTIHIYDSMGGDLVWEATRIADENGDVHIDTSEHTTVFSPGTYIVISDTVTTKDLVLEDVTLDVFDPDLDYLAGTAPAEPGGRAVWVGTGNEGSGCSMDVTADAGTGNWVADFTTVPCDVTADMWAAAQVFDADGDASEANPTPNPFFVVFPEAEWYDARNWPDGITINISVADKPECETSGVSFQHFFNGSFPEGCDLEIGDVVTFTDGETVRTHTVENLSVTEIDPDANTISGIANEGSVVYVWPHESGQTISVTASVSDTWLADFNGIYDIEYGSSGRSQIHDGEGNATAVDWWLPNPYMVVFPEWEFFDGLNWPDGATVIITVADKPECETSKESWGFFFNGNFTEGCDLEIGDEVTFTDGETIRTHTVRNLSVTGIDPDGDTISGTADEGSVVHVWPHDGGQTLTATATAEGTWMVDFSGIYDIEPGSDGRSQINDEQGNGTAVDWHVPKPRMVVFPEWEWFDGLDWPDGATVTITVADKPECETSKESWEFFFNGPFGEGCDLEIGDEVTFTDGETIRTHTVRNLSVTEIDPDGDTISGTADEGSVVYVWPHETGQTLTATTTAEGTWMVDFSGIYDIVPGSDGRSQINDEQGNGTAVDWYVPNPRFIVFPIWDYFEGLDWPDGATVSITVDSKPECETSEVSSNFDFWGVFPEGCDVETGDLVTFTDGETVRTHTIRNLDITELNGRTDTVAGIADPGELVYVWWEETGDTVLVTATISGTWLADFSGVYDFQPGYIVRAQIYDDDGDSTAVRWLMGYEVFLPMTMK